MRWHRYLQVNWDSEVHMLQQEVTRAQKQWQHSQQRLEGLLDAIKAAGVEGEHWFGAHVEGDLHGRVTLLEYFACLQKVVCWLSSREA